MVRLALLALVLLSSTACGGGSAPLVMDEEPPPTVVIDHVAPAYGPRSGGVLVQVVGSGFLSLDASVGVFVRIGDRAAPVRILTDETAVFTLPATGHPGAVGGAPMDVVLVGGAIATGLASAFTVHADVTCAPTAIAPERGTRVTIWGVDVDDVGLSWEGLPLDVLSSGPGFVVVAPPANDVHVGREIPLRVRHGAFETMCLVAVVTGPEVDDVFVNELLPNPGELDANRDGTVHSAGDEFIELVNARDRPLDLSGCSLQDAVAVRHVFPNPTLLPPRAALVVFGSGTPRDFAPQHAGGQAQAATSGSLGLNNGADEVSLLDPDGTLLWFVAYDGSEGGVSLRAAIDGEPPLALVPDAKPSPGVIADE